MLPGYTKRMAGTLYSTNDQPWKNNFNENPFIAVLLFWLRVGHFEALVLVLQKRTWSSENCRLENNGNRLVYAACKTVAGTETKTTTRAPFFSSSRLLHAHYGVAVECAGSVSNSLDHWAKNATSDWRGWAVPVQVSGVELVRPS